MKKIHYLFDGIIISADDDVDLFGFLVEKDIDARDPEAFMENYAKRLMKNEVKKLNFDSISGFLESLKCLGKLKILTPVFVYGSLRKSMHNHYLLEQSHYDGITIVDKMEMFSLNSFPFCKFTENSEDSIMAELYYVDEKTLKRLDQLEGYPNFYDKKLTTDIKSREGYVYFIQNRNGLQKIKNGDWVNFVKSRKNNVYPFL